MRNYIRKAALLAATGLAASAMLATSASAATTFDFTGSNTNTSNSYGNVRTFTGSDGTKVEVSAYSYSSYYGLDDAYVGQYLGGGAGQYGLGVTSYNDGSHTIDNSGRTDILILQFDKVVSVSDLGIYGFGDTDLTWAVGTTATPFAGTLSFSNWTQLDNAFGPFTNSSGSNSNSLVNRSVNAGDLSGNLFFVSAGFSSSNDSFKLSSVTASTGAVPEPATWGMMIGGLAVVGMSMRRRKTAVSFA